METVLKYSIKFYSFYIHIIEYLKEGGQNHLYFNNELIYLGVIKVNIQLKSPKVVVHRSNSWTIP